MWYTIYFDLKKFTKSSWIILEFWEKWTKFSWRNVSSFLLSTKCFIFNRTWNFNMIYYRYWSKKVHKKFTNNFGILRELTKFSKNFNQKWTINTWFFSFFTKDFIFNRTWNFNTIYTYSMLRKKRLVIKNCIFQRLRI